MSNLIELADRNMRQYCICPGAFTGLPSAQKSQTFSCVRKWRCQLLPRHISALTCKLGSPRKKIQNTCKIPSGPQRLQHDLGRRGLFSKNVTRHGIRCKRGKHPQQVKMNSCDSIRRLFCSGKAWQMVRADPCTDGSGSGCEHN